MPIEDDKNKLIKAIEEETKAIWDNQRKPWLLSDVGPFLTKKDIPYKDLISPLTLKKFVDGLDGRVKVVQHSSRRARVGLIPADKTYSFDEEIQSVTPTPHEQVSASRPPSRSTKYAVINFLHAISTLDEADLDKIIIPTSVLAKLFKDK